MTAFLIINFTEFHEIAMALLCVVWQFYYFSDQIAKLKAGVNNSFVFRKDYGVIASFFFIIYEYDNELRYYVCCLL